jgi:hypothetical protein
MFGSKGLPQLGEIVNNDNAKLLNLMLKRAK